MWKQFVYLCIILFIVLTGCSHEPDKNMLYERSFDTLLTDDEHLAEMDYISLFIQNDDIKSTDFSSIETHIQETYQKDTYSYTTAELHQSGAYGKENLNQEGIYLYITEVEEADDYVIVHSEKYYTVKTIDPIGMKMTFSKNDEEWTLDEKTVEWEGSPK